MASVEKLRDASECDANLCCHPPAEANLMSRSQTNQMHYNIRDSIRNFCLTPSPRTEPDWVTRLEYGLHPMWVADDFLMNIFEKVGSNFTWGDGWGLWRIQRAVAGQL